MNLEQKKICSGCNIEQPISHFYKNKDGKFGVHSKCLVCCSERSKEFRKNNPEIMYERYKRHYEKNKISIIKKTEEYRKKNPHIQRKSTLNFVYGITPEQHKKLLNMNGGKCCICNLVPQKRTLFIDHCHKTNVIRGVLCMKCNSALGFLNDDINLLKSAIKYLSEEKYHGLAKL